MKNQTSKIFSGKVECRADLERVIKKLDNYKSGLVLVNSSDMYLQPNVRSGEISAEFHFEKPVNNQKFLEIIESIGDTHILYQTLKPVPAADNKMDRDYDR